MISKVETSSMIKQVVHAADLIVIISYHAEA